LSAPVVWAIVDPRGLITGGVYEHHEDAIADCESRNQVLHDTYQEIRGDYCHLQALPFFADRMAT